MGPGKSLPHGRAGTAALGEGNRQPGWEEAMESWALTRTEVLRGSGPGTLRLDFLLKEWSLQSHGLSKHQLLASNSLRNLPAGQEPEGCLGGTKSTPPLAKF